jgi:WD40 repeat protein
MLPDAWSGIPRSLFRFLGAKKALLLLSGVMGIGVAIFTFPQDPQPASAPFSAANHDVDRIRGLGFAGDSLIVATRGSPTPPDKKVPLRLWDVASGQQRFVLPGHGGGVSAVAFAPDGRLVASAGYDSTLRIWDVATGREQAALHRPQAIFPALAFDSAEGLAWIEDGMVRHWDPMTGMVHSCPPVTVGEALRIAFSRDGGLLATARGDSTDLSTRLWELQACTLRAAFPPDSDRIVCLAFSASGRVLATGDQGGEVHLWNTATGRRFRAFSGLRAWVCALAFSADDTSLAAADGGGTIKVWDVATGHEKEKGVGSRFQGRHRD